MSVPHPELGGEAPDSAGEGDEPYLSDTQANLLIKQILSKISRGQRFPHDSKLTKYAVRKTLKLMQSSKERVASNAIANFTKMVQINQKDEHAALRAALAVVTPERHGSVNVNVGVAVNAGIQQATQEPEYLEWLRERGLAGRGDADAVGANGFRAELPDATSHLGFRPSDNGHDSGA